MPQKKWFLFLLLLFSFQIIFPQGNSIKRDSTALYQNIQNYSKKNELSKWIHRLIFRPIKPETKKINLVQPNYQQFQGKIIRKINIETLDPFGYSEKDSLVNPKNWLERSGNHLHVKTKKIAIRNLLLIKKNRSLDSLLVKESMRLIRSQSYINRVDIITELIAENSDSVDVYIRVLDTWSLLPRVEISDSRFGLELNERNVFGSGHTFNSEYRERFEDKQNAYKLEYIVPNIRNTFIQAKLDYYKDLEYNYRKSIAIDRPFYSPYAKWAGGVYLSHQSNIDSLPNLNWVYKKQNFEYNTQDYWAGYAFRISEENTENSKVTNLITSARFLNVHYLEGTQAENDTIHFFSSERFFLSGIGISTRKFVQDKYIFRSGQTEDVPIGKILGITGGYQFKNNTERLYLGMQLSYGNYFKWGFLSLNFEAGSFFENSVSSQTAFSFQANYFTNLIDLGRWKVRQFIKPQLIIGMHRQNSIGDQLTINEDYGIKGFQSATYGDQKAILTFQTQTYSPWNLLGFRLNPYFNYTMAMLGNEQSRMQWGSKIYSKIGFGFIINNDYLVFRTFQISLAYYPTIPGNGNNVLKTNTFETSDFGFQDFALDKPRTVIYK